MRTLTVRTLMVAAMTALMLIFAACDSGKVGDGAPEEESPPEATPRGGMGGGPGFEGSSALEESPPPVGESDTPIPRGPVSLTRDVQGGPSPVDLERRMKANYAFSCPEELEAGVPEVAELVLSPSLSTEELTRMVDSESVRFTGSTTVTPFVEAKLELAGGDGLVVKATSRDRQKLLPEDQNRWSWQLTGTKPGRYLLSVTLSLCEDGGDSAPLATPVAFNRKIEVIVGEGSGPGGAGPIGVYVFLGLVVLAGLIGLVTLIRKKAGDRRASRATVLPGDPNRHVFVSYSRHDEETVDEIVTELEKAGHRIWIDRAGIEGAASWRAEIVEALSEAQFLVFFASEKSFASMNVGKELAMASDENLTIIPVLLEDCEPSGAGKFVVAGLQRIDGRDRHPREIAAEISEVLTP